MCPDFVQLDIFSNTSIVAAKLGAEGFLMKKVSTAKKRRPRHICSRCIAIRPPRYNVRVVGRSVGKDKRFCCADGYRDHLFGPKVEKKEQE